MANYIETQIRFDKMQSNGIVRKTTESYLVNALSFTEAEARIIEEQTPFISGDFTVSAVKKSRTAEIYRDGSGDRWYRCKLMFITVDENTGAEKRTASIIMVQAPDFTNAFENLLDCMKGTIANFEIAEIAETKIMDVYDAKSHTDNDNGQNVK